MDEETLIYLLATLMVGLIVIFVSAAFGSLRIVAILLSLIGMVVILMVNYVDFLLYPIFTSIFGIKTIPAKDYVIPKDQKSIIKYTNGVYYAIGYVTANIYKYVFEAEQVQSGEEEKLAAAPDTWERIVMNIKFPFRFHLVAASQEVQQFRDELEGRRGYLEFQLGREMQSGNPSQMAIQDLQRRINVIQTRIDRISAGERPVTSVMYIETIATGVSEKEATDNLRGQVDHLQTVFNAFDLATTRVVGREIYLLFKMNFALMDKGMLTKAFHMQK